MSGDDVAMEDHGSPIRKRRPRFRRAQPEPFRLTDGDTAILRLLAEHRFLRSTHIAALVDRSLDRTNDRLRKLFDAGLVDRPRAQLDRFPINGSSPMMYTLTSDGAECLNDVGFEGDIGQVRRSTAVGRPYLDHHLTIADFLVSITLAVRKRGGLVLLGQAALAQEIRERGVVGNPFKLTATVDGLASSAVPDLAFGVRYSDGSRRCFLVEVDRGTMPVVRSNGGTSIAAKLATYSAAYATGNTQRQLGWKAFRVLIATTSEERLSRMCRVACSVARTPELFLFSVASSVEPGIWVSTLGDVTEIF